MSFSGPSAATTSRRTDSSAPGCTRFTTTASSVACSRVSSCRETRTTAATSCGVRSIPPTTSSTGSARLAATSALKPNSVVFAASVKSEPTTTTASQRAAKAR